MCKRYIVFVAFLHSVCFVCAPEYPFIVPIYYLSLNNLWGFSWIPLNFILQKSIIAFAFQADLTGFG